MPFRTDTGGFVPGDDDMADFMNDIIEPFVTDAKAAGGLGWIRTVPVEGNGWVRPAIPGLLARPAFLGSRIACGRCCACVTTACGPSVPTWGG